MRYPWISILLAVCLLPMSWTSLLAAEEETPPPQPIAKDEAPSPARDAALTFSDGTTLRGGVFLLGARKIKIFDETSERYYHIPLESIRRIKVTASKEEKEDEWRWLENASDVKVRTGHFYWWHQYLTTIELTGGKALAGAVRGPIYVRTDEGVTRYLLHDRNKGKLDAPLEELLFIREIDFETPDSVASRPASRPAESAPAQASPGEEIAGPE
ncbi:MAG: hypothetical protein V2A58_17180 [Planctomycetota bacterium]